MQDELFNQVLKWILESETNTTSISAIQRHFSLGFVKTRKCIEQMLGMKVLEQNAKHYVVVASINDFEYLKKLRKYRPKKPTRKGMKKLRKQLYEIYN